MKLFFDDRRFHLGNTAEFAVHCVVYIWYAVAGACTLIALLSPSPRLGWLGVLLALFFGDRLLHLGKGEEKVRALSGDSVNVAQSVTPRTHRILDRAFHRSLATGSDFSITLFADLTRRAETREVCTRLGVDYATFLERVESAHVSSGVHTTTPDELRVELGELAIQAYESALATQSAYIQPHHFLAALARSSDPVIIKTLSFFEINPNDFQNAIIFGQWQRRFRGLRRLPAVLGGFVHTQKLIRHRVMNRAWTARPTPTLDAMSTDLTDLAREEQLGFLVGHEREFDQLINIISRPGKPNALLIGDAGVGKTTMIAHLAFRIIKDEVPRILFDKRLVSLDVGGLIANATPEVLTGRLRTIANEIIEAGNIVLFIPEIHNLFRGDRTSGITAIDILLPLIRSQAIPVIGETYPREFKGLVEERSDFLEQFEVVHVDELSEEESILLLTHSALILERDYRVSVTFRAVRRSVELAHRYLRSRPLPGSAMDLLKQAFARASSEGLTSLDEDTVIAVTEQQSKIPIQRAGEGETEKLLHLEDTIHKKLINQTQAVSAVSRALREYRSGLSRRGGPIATFLFVGPTGVGKTELAKQLADIQFGSKEAMCRFDMSEFQDKQSIARFIGAPDASRSGSLTDAVMLSPYSLILLDEFEKAHPDIINLFLQVFDDGRLTDSAGRTVSFENTIIIATSNAHSVFIKESVESGMPMESVSEALKKKLTDYFKPELINRFSDVVVFRNLTEEEIRAVASIMVCEVVTTLLETHGMTLTVDADAIAELARRGYSPVFGARPLRQAISENIRSVLAEKILRKEIARGNTLALSAQNGTFVWAVTA